MHIKRLWLSEARILKDFEVKFYGDGDENGGKNGGGSSYIIIGENGSGKSTFLEKLTEIFMSFDMGRKYEDVSYDYELEYTCHAQDVTIIKAGRKYTITVDDNTLFDNKSINDIRSYIKDSNPRIFPERFSLFYSGSNDKLQELIKPVNRRYKSTCMDLVRNELEGNRGEDFPKRRFNYCDDALIGIYLIAIYGGTNKDSSKIKRSLWEHCAVNGIGNVNFSLKIKSFPTVVREALFSYGEEKILDIFDLMNNRLRDYLGSCYKGYHGDYLLFEMNIEELFGLGLDRNSIFNFFEKLVTLYNAKYTVYVHTDNGIFKISELSEGQRQIIKILGMLTVCGNEDSFVIMDEPDAHMNPKWKYSIKGIIDEALGENRIADTQAIVVTHDPLVINGVDNEYIRIFTSDGEEGKICAVKPEESTVGMGIDGLLQSSYYGRRTSYDKTADDMFCERQKLYLKVLDMVYDENAAEVSQEELDKLAKYTDELSQMHISVNSVDFLYDDFLREYRNSRYYGKEYLSYEECQARNAEIRRIIDRLLSKKEPGNEVY